jgi:hypothetical protein
MSERTVAELRAKYGVHPTIIHQCNKALMFGAAETVGNPLLTD